MIKSLKYLSWISIGVCLGLPLLSLAVTDPCSQLNMLPSTTGIQAANARSATAEAASQINACLFSGDSALSNSLQSSAAPTINNSAAPTTSGSIDLNTPAPTVQPIQLAPTNKTTPSKDKNTGIFNY